MSDWITLISSLTGVVIGAGMSVAAEPFKTRIARKDQAKRTVVERCVSLITNAETCRLTIIEINLAHRARAAGRRAPIIEQIDEWSREHNAARAEVRKIATLLHMSDSKQLADQATAVAEAMHKLFLLIHTGDDGEYTRNKTPEKLRIAIDEFDEAVLKFAELAREYGN
jgi:hypothetical protein